MNRPQYIAALTFWFKAETIGAIAGEVAMLLRENPEERRKLDLFRRVEASNKILCRQAIRRDGADDPPVETSIYRNGYKLGQRLGEGDWDSFLDRFEATVHPEEFTRQVLDEHGIEITHEYSGVDASLLKHLVRHEQALAKFVARERGGQSDQSTTELEQVLHSKLCSGLVGPNDPVGW